MFDTFGPFVLKAHDTDSLNELFEQIHADNPSLENGIGVYMSPPETKRVACCPAM
jgi:hypothetical protein